jgi:hypothetical protein
VAARTLAAIALGLALLPVLLELLFSLSGRPGRWGPVLLAALPVVAVCAAVVSLFLPGLKGLSWLALLLGAAGCAVVLWLAQMKPNDWR